MRLRVSASRSVDQVRIRSREMVATQPSAAPTVAAPNLPCTGLRKRFGGRQAVDGVGFEIAQGETYGLLGPNGAGKTTTIAMLCGVLARDDGEGPIAGGPG